MREQTAEQVGLAASGAAFWLVITILPAAIAAVSVYGLVVSPQQVARNLSGLPTELCCIGSSLTSTLTNRNEPTRSFETSSRPFRH